MRVKKKGKQLLAALLSVIMASSTATFTAAVPVKASERDESFAAAFEQPDFSSKPKIRWWWPSGAVDQQQVRREIDQLVEQGFGGAEILAWHERTDDTHWNSDAYIFAIRDALQYIEENYKGFKLDIAFSFASKPSAINSITLEDEEYISQQLIYDKKVIAPGDTAVMELRTENAKLLSVSAYQINHETKYPYQRSGMLGKSPMPNYVYEENKVILTHDTSAVDLDTGIVTWSAPAGSDSWVLIAVYQSATQQMNEQYPVIDHLNAEAFKKVLDYYDENIIPYWEPYKDSLGAMFVDSYEFNFGEVGFMDILMGTHTSKSFGAMWTHDFFEQFKLKRGYDIAEYLAYVFSTTCMSNVADLFGGTFGEEGIIDTADNVSVKIRNDYYQTVTDLFIENYLQPLQTWCEQYGWDARVQNYGLAVDMTQANLSVGIPETESMYFTDIIDGYRLGAGSVHMGRKNIYSTEVGVESGGNYAQKLTDLVDQINISLAGGINQMVLHGSSYSGEFSGADNEDGFVPNVAWPGYEGFGTTSYANSWGERQVQWGQMGDSMGYVARNQYTMRQGEAKIDIAFYRNTYFETQMYHPLFVSGLEENGYSYEFISPALMDLDHAVVANINGKSVLDAGGPAYKALVLNQENRKGNQVHPGDSSGTLAQLDVSLAALRKIISYADAGLPIVFVGELPATSKFYSEDDLDVTNLVQELLDKNNVYSVENESALVNLFKSINVLPDVSYEQPASIVNLHRQDKAADYYYFYNQSEEMSSAEITLEGTGRPYLLDAWTGEIRPIAQYSQAGGKISIRLNLAPKDTALIAIAEETWYKGSDCSSVYVIQSDEELEWHYNKTGELTARGKEDGTYSYTLSNGISGEVVVSDTEIISLESWTLDVTSWRRPLNYATTQRTTIDKVKLNTIQLNRLVSWKEIDGLEDVSGIGVYVAEFRLDKWDPMQSAEITLGEICDVYRITINGTVINSGNQINTSLDIGKYLKSGDNQIAIQVATTFVNYMNHMNSSVIQPMSGKVNDRSDQDYGLIGLDGAVTIQIGAEKTVTTSNLDLNELQLVFDTAQYHIDNGDVDKLASYVKEGFMNAYNDAKDILKNPDRYTQADANTAWAALMTEIHKLNFIPGNKFQLQELYDNCALIDLNLYKDDMNMSSFRAAMRLAEYVLVDDDALELEIDDSYRLLLMAVNALVRKADKSQLEYAIYVAESYDPEIYVQDINWKNFQEELKKAKEVFDDEDAEQEVIASALNALINSMLKIRIRADKSLLEKTVAKALEIDLGGYTDASVSAFRKVLSEAQAMLDDYDLDKNDNPAIKAMAARLENAINELVIKKSSGSETGSTESSDETDSTASTSDTDGASMGKYTGTAPKTGDSSPIAGLTIVFFSVLFFAGGIIAATRKKKL